MIIKNFTQRTKGDTFTFSADILLKGERKTHTVFFTLPKEQKPSLLLDATPFVAALLIPAMKRKEDILVEGSTISSRFLQNMSSLMTKLHSWEKGFSPISIHAKIRKDSCKPTKTASFFSGGVDSFYTYLKAKKTKNPITTFLFVHGFDIELENTSFYDNVLTGLEKLAKEENVDLLTLRTNIKRIVEPYVEWDWTHGGALAAVALLFRKEIQTVYISGALRFDQLFPYGTHPEIDYLWGTETLSLIHDGNEYDRLDKVVQVVGKSDLALAHLRVCNQNLKGKYNCSHCFKCLWTMMTLECAKSLHEAKTFEPTIDLEAVKKMRYTFEKNYHLAGIRVIDHLKKDKRRRDLQEAVKESLTRSKTQTFTQRVAQRVAELDKTYNKRRLYTTIFALNTSQDRNTIFKLLAKQGIIK